MCDRIHIGELGWLDLQLRGSLPIAALHHIARVAGSQRIEPSEALVAGDRGHLIDDGAGILVVGKLQIGIDQIVLAVHLVVPFLVSLGGLAEAMLDAIDSFQ